MSDPGPARFLYILLGFCLCVPVAALDYVAPKLICVLGPADAIVRTGHSENIIDDFVVAVEEIIRGDGLRVSDKIRISGEGKWYAETKLASVSEYDSAILFLIREAEADGWRIIGSLGAGRMLVRDGYVYLAGFQSEIPRKQYRPGEPALQRVALVKMLQAERDIRECLTWNRDRDVARPQVICSEVKVQRLKMRSSLHRLLVDEVLESRDSDLVCPL